MRHALTVIKNLINKHLYTDAHDYQQTYGKNYI